MENQGFVATVYRSPFDGSLGYERPDGTFVVLDIIQDNIFKIYDEDVATLNNTTDYQIVQIPTQDGISTFRLVSTPEKSITVGGTGGARTRIFVSDEGTTLGSFTNLNFVGLGVSVSLNGNTATVTINGGGAIIGGGGTLNFIPKFTPDGTHIGDSQLYDNGTSIGFDTVTPQAVATFDIVSTTQGILFPRMTTAQRDLIAVGAGSDSLFIYNSTTNKYNYWDNDAGQWQSIDTHMGTGDVEGSGTTGQLTQWTDGPNSIIGDSGITTASVSSLITNAFVQNGNTFGANAVLGTNDAFSLSFETSGVTRGTISSGGLWGINTSPVAGTLVTMVGTGATSATYSLVIHNSSGTNNSLIVRDDGYVGIGIAAPLSPLSVQASLTGVENYLLTLTNTNNAAAEYSGIKLNAPFAVVGGAGFGFVRMGAQAGTGTFDIGSTTNWHDDFYTNNILRMRIHGTTGFVGIGTSTTSPMASLQVRGSGTTSTTVAFMVQDSTPTDWFYLRDDHNVGLQNGDIFGTNAVGVIGIGNGTAPTTSPANMIQIFSVDTDDATASLGLRTEQAVVTEAVVSDRTLKVTINGTIYKICLKV